MRGESEVSGEPRTAMMVAACALIALLGAKALAQDADDETWYFGYEEVECGGAPYLATSNLATIRREEARNALLSSHTVGRDDSEHVFAILRGERSASDAGPCGNAAARPDPTRDPAGPADDTAAFRAVGRARAALEEARADLAARQADLRAVRAAAGTARVEAGPFSGYADNKCEGPVVETTRNMARIVELTVAGEISSFSGSLGTCIEISPADG